MSDYEYRYLYDCGPAISQAQLKRTQEDIKFKQAWEDEKARQEEEHQLAMINLKTQYFSPILNYAFIALVMALVFILFGCAAKPKPGSLADYKIRLERCQTSQDALIEKVREYQHTVQALQSQCR